MVRLSFPLIFTLQGVLLLGILTLTGCDSTVDNMVTLSGTINTENRSAAHTRQGSQESGEPQEFLIAAIDDSGNTTASFIAETEHTYSLSVLKGHVSSIMIFELPSFRVAGVLNDGKDTGCFTITADTEANLIFNEVHITAEGLTVSEAKSFSLNEDSTIDTHR